MRFSKLKLVVALPLFLGIVACDRSSVDQEQSQDQVDIENSPELQVQDKVISKSIVEDKTIESSDDYFSNEDFLIDGVSSKEYKDLNQYGTADEQGFRDFITKTIIAKNPQAYSDQDKLNILSLEYISESDGFKRQELAKQLLPKINADLEKYKEVLLVKVPIIGGNYHDFADKQKSKNKPNFVIEYGPFILEPYNFENKSFASSCRIILHSQLPTLENHDNIQFMEKPTSISELLTVRSGMEDDNCPLEVEDEELARKIENAISNNNIDFSGEVYLKLDVASDKIIAIPVLRKLNYINKENNEILLSTNYYYDQSLS